MVLIFYVNYYVCWINSCNISSAVFIIRAAAEYDRWVTIILENSSAISTVEASREEDTILPADDVPA